MRFKQIKDGEWVQPVLKGYKMQCCDCGLIHVIDFKILEDKEGKFLKFRAKRLNEKIHKKRISKSFRHDSKPNSQSKR